MLYLSAHRRIFWFHHKMLESENGGSGKIKTFPFGHIISFFDARLMQWQWRFSVSSFLSHSLLGFFPHSSRRAANFSTLTNFVGNLSYVEQFVALSPHTAKQAKTYLVRIWDGVKLQKMWKIFDQRVLDMVEFPFREPRNCKMSSHGISHFSASRMLHVIAVWKVAQPANSRERKWA